MHLRLQYIASFKSTPFNRLQRLPHLCTFMPLKEMLLSQAPAVYQEWRAFKQTQGRRGHFDTLTAVVSDQSTDGRGTSRHARPKLAMTSVDYLANKTVPQSASWNETPLLTFTNVFILSNTTQKLPASITFKPGERPKQSRLHVRLQDSVKRVILQL